MNKMNKTGVVVSNPMLIAAMELVKKNNSPKNFKVFADELKHARFLSPVVILPPPTPDENGRVKLTAEHKVHVPMATTKDGKKLFTAFTDAEELKKAAKDAKLNVFGFEFKDYVQMVEKADESCVGFIINPYGDNMVITREVIRVITGGQKPEAGAEAAANAEAPAEAVSVNMEAAAEEAPVSAEVPAEEA